MKITRKMHNELLKELREIKEVMEANKASAENAAENARRLDDDVQQDRCYEAVSIYSTNINKIDRLLDEYDEA